MRKIYDDELVVVLSFRIKNILKHLPEKCEFHHHSSPSFLFLAHTYTHSTDLIDSHRHDIVGKLVDRETRRKNSNFSKKYQESPNTKCQKETPRKMRKRHK